jgi:hypothetical protein
MVDNVAACFIDSQIDLVRFVLIQTGLTGRLHHKFADFLQTFVFTRESNRSHTS